MRKPWGLSVPAQSDAGIETFADASQLLESSGNVHGFCYLTKQAYLIFGHNRREPKPWRPSVSLRRTTHGLYVLPSTTQPAKDFFHLPPKDCLEKRKPPGGEKDSYLCPRYELVPQDAIIEIGIVPQSARLAIASWFVKNWVRRA